MLRYLCSNFHMFLVESCPGVLIFCFFQPVFLEDREIQVLIVRSQASVCSSQGKRMWGNWPLLWSPPCTMEIHPFPMLSSLSPIIDSCQWWLVKMSFKKLLELVGQARVSPAAIISGFADDIHYYTPLPLISTSLYHQLICVVAQWSHWDLTYQNIVTSVTYL